MVPKETMVRPQFVNSHRALWRTPFMSKWASRKVDINLYSSSSLRVSGVDADAADNWAEEPVAT